MTLQTSARTAGTAFLLYIAVGLSQLAVAGRARVLLTLAMTATAFTLAAALYALTRDEDRDLAALAFAFRCGESVLDALSTSPALALPTVGATLFACGSTLFSWLLLRGQLIPRALAWLGVAASVLLVICLPLQLAGVLSGMVTRLFWLPMAAYEIPLGVWLIVKGGQRVPRAQ